MDDRAFAQYETINLLKSYIDDRFNILEEYLESNYIQKRIEEEY